MHAASAAERNSTMIELLGTMPDDLQEQVTNSLDGSSQFWNDPEAKSAMEDWFIDQIVNDGHDRQAVSWQRMRTGRKPTMARINLGYMGNSRDVHIHPVPYTYTVVFAPSSERNVSTAVFTGLPREPWLYNKKPHENRFDVAELLEWGDEMRLVVKPPLDEYVTVTQAANGQIIKTDQPHATPPPYSDCRYEDRVLAAHF